jgi:PAS domain S-box-containing protein/putative nucleotidyltransferase with HDIG domain
MFLIEFGFTLLAAVITTVLVVQTGIIEQLVLRSGGAHVDPANLGPGLLVLSMGLGIMALRRWKEAERERVLYDTAAMRYQALAGNTQDILFFSSPDGRIVDCNEAAVLRYGYSRSELLAMTVFDLRAPGTALPTGVELTSVPGDATRFSQVHATKDGTVIDLAVSAQRVMIGSNEVVVSVCHDVTARLKGDRELRQSEARYRGLIEMSPSPIIVYTSDRTIVFANQAVLDLVRADEPSQVIGHPVSEFVHPDSSAAAEAGRVRLEKEGVTPFLGLRLRRLDGSPVAVQMASGRTTFEGGEAFQTVMQDVSALKDEAENLRRTTQNTISAMARLTEARDPYTAGHQERVAVMAVRIAERMDLSESVCEAIRVAGIVHDIGKINVPAEILSKPGRLTDSEFALIRQHAEAGYELLLPIEFPWPIAEIVRQHHERLNGSGYPRGLEDGAICIEARVLAVADTVEAMSAHRPYRAALGIEAALSAIGEGRGRLYDKSAVDAAIALAADGALLDTSAPGMGDGIWTAA